MDGLVESLSLAEAGHDGQVGRSQAGAHEQGKVLVTGLFQNRNLNGYMHNYMNADQIMLFTNTAIAVQPIMHSCCTSN